MFESAPGRQLTRLIAVLLGVVLWSPGLGAGLFPKLAQASQASCADAGEPGEHERGSSEKEFSEVREGEDSEVEDSLVEPATGAAPLRLFACSASDVIASRHERPRLSAGYDIFARERGPPVV